MASKTADVVSGSVCTNCHEDGVSKDVYSFCYTCDRYFCIACDKVHGKITTNHKTVSGQYVPTQGEKQDFIPCKFHSQENLAFYCKNHDLVICNTCSKVKHRKCDVGDFSVVFEGRNLSEEHKELSSKFLCLQEFTENVKSEKQESLRKYRDDAGEKRHRIQYLRQELNGVLDKYEKQLESQQTSDTETLKEAILALESLDKEISSQTSTFEKESGNRIKKIISLNKFKKFHDEYQCTIEDIQSENTPCKAQITEDERLPALIQELTRVGQQEFADSEEIVEKAGEEQIKPQTFLDIETCSSVQCVDTKVFSDGKMPCITGCCISNEYSILCDNTNSKVKILDKELKVKFILPCSSAPFDVACLDENNVVVTLPQDQALQYISIKPGVKLNNRKLINIFCSGIYVHKEYIFVCASGMGVNKLSKYGEHILSVSPAGFYQPQYVCLDADGSKMYCSGGNDVYCVTKEGHALYAVHDTSKRTPKSLICDDSGNLIVCDGYAHCIYIVDSNGSVRKTLLSEREKFSPTSMTLNKSNNTLVVASCSFYTQGSSILTVYKLK